MSRSDVRRALARCRRARAKGSGSLSARDRTGSRVRAEASRMNPTRLDETRSAIRRRPRLISRRNTRT